VDRLLPVIAEIKDHVRRAHYLQKLAGLVKVSERSIEAALREIKPAPVKSKPKKATQVGRSLVSSPLEEYCLALLLQHPELRDNSEGLLLEYFDNSENHEVFIAWQNTEDTSRIKEELDTTIWEHFDYLMSKNLLTNQIESKYTDCVLRLREKFLRALEAKREVMLASEAEAGGTGADVTKLEQEGTAPSDQLREVFAQRDRMRSGIKGDRKWA
jgi:DNA primase